MKSDISDDFPIFFSIQLTKEKLREGVIKIKKKLSLLHWRHIDFNGTVNEIHDINFPIRENILKEKNIKSPWISKGLKKSSKKKQKSYIKFLKTKPLEDQFKYKTYKSLFEN